MTIVVRKCLQRYYLLNKPMSALEKFREACKMNLI